MTEQAEKEVPRLSYSVAQTLVTKTPAHAFDQHRLLGGNGRKDTEAMDTGRLMEKFVLGADLDKIVIVEAENWQTKAAKEQREAAYLNGNQAVLRKHYDEADLASSIILTNFRNKGIELDAKTDEAKGIEILVQKRVEWTSPEGVLCSGVIDRLVLDHKRGKAMIQDLKTSSDLGSKEFARSVYKYGYNVQQVSYEEAVGALWPAFQGRTDTQFLVAETESPYCVRVITLGGALAHMGRVKWNEAKATWAECMAKNEWPGYPDERIEAAQWMQQEAIEAAMAKGTDYELVQQLGGILQ